MVWIGLGEAAIVPLTVMCVSFYKFSALTAATISIIAITAYFFASFMGLPELNVSDLDMLRQILVQDFGSFQNRVIADFFIGNQTIRMHMVNVMTDQHWKDVRRTITPAFTPGRVEKMMPIMSRCIRTAESVIDDLIDESNGIIDAKTFFANLTMDVIAQCAFGVDLGTQKEEESKFIEYSQKIFDQSYVDYRIMLLTLFPNIARLMEKIFKFQFIGNYCDEFFVGAIQAIIEERRKCPRQENPDFLQLLLNTTDESKMVEADGELMQDAVASGKKITLTDRELVAQGYLFLAAGYETTATTLQFAAYSLAANPQVQETAYAQIMEVVGHKDTIAYDDLVNMPYLEQVMNETLRMYPPVPRNDRKCGSNITVGGVAIEKGTFVYVPTFALHYDERYYPNPERFDPDRFSPAERAKRDPLTFVPFGYGPRNCIGMRFSQVEIRLALAQLLRKFQFTLPEMMKDKVLELDTTRMTKPKTPIFIAAKRRAQ